MSASRRTEMTLMRVSPESLSAYVRFRNWDLVGRYRENSDIYAGDGLPEIIVPRTRQLADYDMVLTQLIDLFSQLEDRSPETVYKDLLYADRDVIRVTVDAEESGVLPLDDAVSLLNGARNVLTASARSYDERRPVLQARKSRDATRFLREVSMGQTEEGSYAVTFLPPPLPATSRPMSVHVRAMETDLAATAADPYQRRMTRHLFNTLSEVRKASDIVERVPRATFDQSVERAPLVAFGELVGSTPILALGEAVRGGVSANLCDALIQLIGSHQDLNISVAWAATMPMPQTLSTIPFYGEDSAVLEGIARHFREDDPRLDHRLFGKVIRLSRTDIDMVGTITVRADIDDRLQSVTIVLRDGDYRRAVDAHQRMAFLELGGDLYKQGRRWHLLNPKVIRVIEDDEDGGFFT